MFFSPQTMWYKPVQKHAYQRPANIMRTLPSDMQECKGCCITQNIILIKYFSTNQKTVYFLHLCFYIAIRNITFDKWHTEIEPWSHSLLWTLLTKLWNYVPFPVEQPQSEYINFMSAIKHERAKILTSTQAVKEGQVRTWSSGLVKSKACANLLFLSWENDFAHGTDVPRAIWLCELQFGERWHDTAGEVSECRAGWLDGILKYLGGEIQTHFVIILIIC